jgi:hypothetical protein
MQFPEYQRASEFTKLESLSGVSPPNDRSLLTHARENIPSTRNEWQWSGFHEAHKVRLWKWDEYRLAARREPPLFLDYRDSVEPKIDYIRAEDIVEFLKNDNHDNPSVVRLVLSFTTGKRLPCAPALDLANLSTIEALFGVQWLQQYYPSQITASFSRAPGPNRNTHG